jgi:hypothetical protein
MVIWLLLQGKPAWVLAMRIPIGCELVPRGNVITLQSPVLTLPDSALATDSTHSIHVQFKLYYLIDSNPFGCWERTSPSTRPSPHATYSRAVRRRNVVVLASLWSVHLEPSYSNPNSCNKTLTKNLQQAVYIPPKFCTEAGCGSVRLKGETEGWLAPVDPLL